MQTPLLMKNAEPFLYPGDQTGCLLIHGFTGTPWEMRGLGEHLAGQGHTVLGVRLPGHATRLEDMVRMRWWDWLAAVEDGYHLLQNMTKQIFVIGLSMGGILALTFAARFKVAGVVAMAAPHHLPDDPRLRFIRLIALYQPYRLKGEPKWFDMPAAERHVSYDADPTLSYLQLQALLETMRSGLPQVTVPALLIYSQNDPSVTPQDGHMDAIFAALGSQKKEKLMVEKSGHILTNDMERERVRDRVAGFVTENTRAAT